MVANQAGSKNLTVFGAGHQMKKDASSGSSSDGLEHLLIASFESRLMTAAFSSHHIQQAIVI